MQADPQHTPPPSPPSPLPPSECTTSELCALLAPVTLADPAFANWAGTYRCRPQRTFMPTDSHQLPYIFELARRERTTVRAAGAGHSPSDLACTSGFMVRTDALDRVLQVSPSPEIYHMLHSPLSFHPSILLCSWASLLWCFLAPLRSSPCSAFSLLPLASQPWRRHLTRVQPVSTDCDAEVSLKWAWASLPFTRDLQPCCDLFATPIPASPS